MIAHQDLKDAVVHCEQVKDYTSRELFRGILDSEEEHIDWLETQLDMIGKMGIQNYIQLQSSAAE
jgi:bacterioferritin